MKNRLSITAKLALGSFVIAFLPMMILGNFLLQNIKSEMLQATKGNILVIVNSVSEEINTNLADSLNDVTFVGRIPLMSAFARQAINDRDTESARKDIRDIFIGACRNDDEFAAFFFLHPETGEVLSSNLREYEGKFFNEKPYFEPGKKKPVIYGIHYSPDLEKNIMAIAAPVMHGNELSGVVAAWLKIDELSVLLRNTAPIDSYMVSRSNIYILGDPEKNEASLFRSGIPGDTVTRALRGETGSDIYRNHNAVDVVGAYAYIPILDMALIAETPLSEVLEKANTQGLKYFFGMIVSAVFILLAAIFYGSRITRPIVHLTKAIKSIGEKEADEEISVPEGNPEVAELTTAFNKMFAQRRAALKALRESEARLAESQHIAHMGSWEYNTAEKKLWWSEEVYRIFLLDRNAELTFDLFISFVHPEDREALLDQIRSNKPHRPDYRIVRRDGVVRYIHEEIVMIKDKDGKLIKVRGTAQDITERRRIEELLRKGEERYRLLFEKAPLGIMHFNINGEVTDCNEKFAEIIGAPKHEIARFNLRSLRDLQMKKAVEDAFSGKTGRYEGRYLSVTGNKASSIKGDFAPVIATDGSVTGGIGVFEDISERKKLEEQLLHAQKMEAVGQLAGGVAHDFNNILTALVSYTYLLQKRLKEDSVSLEMVEKIMKLSDRAKNITQGLLTFSRKQYFEFRPQKMNTIVREAEKLLTNLISEDIELRTVLSDEELSIIADRHQLEQVIINLAANAQDVMPGGGILSITTGRIEIDNEFIRQHGFGETGMYALLSVTDTGFGMDKATREKIFEPFFTTKEVGKGTGLGLAIVYGIIKQHNGFISARSEPGKGTTFEIYLPEIKASSFEIRDTEYFQPAGASATVLIAEDDNMVRDSVKSILEYAGHRVFEARDGLEAIEIFMSHRDEIEILLLDIVMPRKNGRETYEAIKRSRPDIPAIFMSGYTADVIQEKKILSEDFHFIRKPVIPAELLEKIRSILGK